MAANPRWPGNRHSTDVLVIGAGPAGAVVATALARHGLSVLLADAEPGGASPGGRPPATPRGADHGLVVSAQAMRALAALGLPAAALARPMRALHLGFGGPAWRPISGAQVAVSDRASLRDGLRRAAVAAGAEQVAGRVESVSRTARGFEAIIANPVTRTVLTMVAARHIVAATGSAPGAAADAIGAACARRYTGVTLRGRLLLVLSVPPATNRSAPPTSIWVMPSAHQTVTITVNVAGGATEPDAEGQLRAALAALTEADPRFSALRPAGQPAVGPLDAGFAPDRIAASDYLLVGDAAGLVNPFTGEGLGPAVASGLLAARCIAGQPADPDAARQDYADRLSARFVGYFETARYAARRYHLTWRILGASARSDHPFHVKARRAILLPEGLAAIAPADHVNLAPCDMILAMPFLAACDEVVIATIRARWPFLARLMLDEGGPDSLRLRPAMLFLAGSLAGGKPPDPRLAALAAGIELAQLGTLAFLGSSPSSGQPTRGVDWAVAATVLAGDFLLAQASRLVAESAPEASWSFADWLAELTAIRASRLDRARPPAVAPSAVFASLFEFPARMGALLADCEPAEVQAVRDVGHHCGHAFLHAEDVLALRGERTRLDATLKVMLRSRLSAIPEHISDRLATEKRLSAEPRLRLAALAAARRACAAARRDALAAAKAVPDPTAARLLRQFAVAVAAPAAHRHPAAAGAFANSPW